ncbi:DNA polymerase eta [Bicyclus anynana]|uniref:DNA polymerase eta n=1 Tax=Bicyclus anynana TaxID=110368 RepID=A0A6J1NYC4_BICAN|nr:DNA polymerase eta [Bicyclus anynana]
MDHENRVVVLIDMDCFYCQVEEKLNPDFKGKPIAVVQYNPWKGGGIIAVNYVARAMGVTRHMRGDEAKEKCPEIQLPSVPCQRGKADITKYRDAGKDVAKILQKFTPLLERASIDEAYLDITSPVQKRLETLNIQALSSDMMPHTFALGYDSMEEFVSEVHACGSDSIEFDYEHAKKLLVGALIVSEIRAAVFNETGYTCSAGIAHNKILAKLVCGMNKPNKQTVLPKHSVDILYKTLSIKKVKHLGGKFGDAVCEVLRIKTMAELQHFTEKELQAKFDEKNGTWLYNIARGTDLEPVQARFNPKSIGCCKQLRGKAALLDLDSLKKWLKDLGDEIEDRLEKDALENNRTPKQMVVSFSLQVDGRDISSSRSYNFTSEDDLCGETFSNKALELVMDSSEGCKTKDGETNRRLKAPFKFLGISVGKFEDNNETKKTKTINDYFSAGSSKDIHTSNESSTKMKNIPKNNEGKNYVLQKFLNSGKGSQKVDIRKEEEKLGNAGVIEATLDRQESFFAKYLNKYNNTNTNQLQESDVNKEKSHINVNSCNNIVHSIDNVEGNSNLKLNSTDNEAMNVVNNSNTIECKVIPCGDDSNDTNYSSSTINDEINKSIALFEEDPEEIVRVSNMRELLNKKEETLENDVTHKNYERNTVEPQPTRLSPLLPKPKDVSIINCSECGKPIPVNKLDEHADYHLALKLREEERNEVRKEREINAVKDLDNKEKHHKKKPISEEMNNKNETLTSITSFLTKIDNGVPTRICSECGKKIVVEKFLEHQDFHEAQKLSRELNKRTAFPHTSVTSTSSSKRKRKPGSPTKKPKMQCKSIDLFFR